MAEEQENNQIIKVDDVEIKGIDNLPITKLSMLKNQDIRHLDGFATFEVSAVIPGSDVETSTLYPVFYVANTPCFLLRARLRHDVSSTSGTIDVEKLINGIAKGSGVSMIQSVFDISTGARTTITKNPTSTLANSQLSPGDAVSLKPSGTLTNGRDICVTLLFGVLLRDLPNPASI